MSATNDLFTIDPAANGLGSPSCCPVGSGVYRTIMADPPWPIEWAKSAGIRMKELDYITMPVAEIAAMPVKSLAADDCRLLLWTTNQFLPDAIHICRLWGFRYKMLMTWCKPTGMGAEPRIATEHIILGYRGNPKRMNSRYSAQVLNWWKATATGKHSEKPGEILRVLDEITDTPRIELFARKPREGWHVWGNEVASDINFVTGADAEERTSILDNKALSQFPENEPPTKNHE